uniref:Uncharacterized protein n=1 Tax=Ciona intestinalis TaxID=7719 RepID=F6ZLF1_CIOIN
MQSSNLIRCLYLIQGLQWFKCIMLFLTPFSLKLVCHMRLYVITYGRCKYVKGHDVCVRVRVCACSTVTYVRVYVFKITHFFAWTFVSNINKMLALTGEKNVLLF